MALTLTLPDVGGDDGTWGTELNTAITSLNNSTLFARKSADETVSASTSLQDDDHLTLTLGVGTYVVEFLGIASGASGGDIKIAWAFAGTATSYRTGAGPTVATTSPLSTTAAATTVAVNRMAGASDSGTTITASVQYGTDGSNWSMILEKGLLVVTVGGILKIQWAQIAATGSTVLRAGSYLLANQVA